MSHAVKVKRSGIAGIFKKKNPFLVWISEQPRKDLTYKKDIERREEKGWVLEDFIRESWERGVDVRMGTVNKWREGHKPRVIALHALREAFPTIQF